MQAPDQHVRRPVIARRPPMVLRILLAVALTSLACAAPTTQAHAQQDNPVYVDDSPQARELLRQARDQTRSNAGEAVRLYQELLNDFAYKLVPSSDVATDHFTSVRIRIMAALLTNQSLLDRYRLVQTPAAEQLLQDGHLEIVARSYPLTEPGLEASLRLAQRDLEAGRFLQAISRLNRAPEHPDFIGRRAAHGLYMQSLAWHALGRPVFARASRDALLTLGTDGEAFDQHLEQLFSASTPSSVHAYTVLDVGPAPALSDVVAQPIWSIPLEDSLYRRRMRALNEPELAASPINRNGMTGRALDADMATTALTVVGPLAYLNQGHTILALDRLTGREVWSYQDLSRLGMTESGGGLDAHDLNVTAFEGDAIVSLTGHAQPGRRSDTGRVICLEAGDGSLRWSSRLSGIIDSAPDEEIFAHGSPIIRDGLAYVLARKVSAQLLTSAYVVALNVSDGSVAWARFIAASGGLRIAARPFDTLVEQDGRLYVSSAVGATAAVEATTGEIRWLRRFNVPINTPIADQTRRPWEMSAPVVTSRGLVAIQPDARRVVLLDLETGNDLANHSASTSADWNSPRYLLSDGERVIGVGSDIRGFSVDGLDAPIWRVPALALQQSPDEPAPVDSLVIRGRVQLADDRLVAPTSEGVLIIDVFTGRIEQTLPIEAVGNPLAYESQLLIAGADRLDAFMSMRRAEELLRRQLAQSLDDPGPALSLLRLGIRAGDISLALEAADHAMNAAAAHADDPAYDAQRFLARAELFALLLDLARSKSEFTIEQGEAVFARLQQAAVGPEQRVEHLLAYGDWLSRSQADALARAVETWQSVLADQRLASTMISIDGIERPARDRAIARLGAVIAARGTAAYGPQADFASMRLSQLREAAALGVNDGKPAEEDLLALAHEFPFSNAAYEAIIGLAERRVAHGDVAAALALLTEHYLNTPSPVSASKLFGRFADIAERDGRDQQAREALEFIRATWGDIELETGSNDPASPDAIGSLTTLRLSRRASQLLQANNELPTLGSLNGDSRTLGGPAIPALRELRGRLPRDRFLVRDGGGASQLLRLVTAEKLNRSAEIAADQQAASHAWEAAIEGSLPHILQMSDQSLVIWMAGESEDAERSRAVSINWVDGTTRWSMPPVRQLIPDWGARSVPGSGAGRAAREQLPNGDSFDPNETFALANDQTLILIHRRGHVAAVSAADGNSVLWSLSCPLEQVHWATLRHGMLVMAGMGRQLDASVGAPRDRGEADAQQSPTGLTARIVAIDAMTGQPMFGEHGVIEPRGRSGIKWMHVNALGVVVFGSADGIEAASVARGARLWATNAYGTMDSHRAWETPVRVVFEDQRSRLRSIHLVDGEVSEPFELPLRGEWDPMELREVLVADQTLFTRFGQRIVMFDSETGRVIGADAVAEDRDFRWLIETQDALIAVSFSSSQRPMNAAGGINRTQYQYTAYALSRNGKVLGTPIRTEPLPERIQNVAAIDGWLLLSTLTDTLAIPMNGP